MLSTVTLCHRLKSCLRRPLGLPDIGTLKSINQVRGNKVSTPLTPYSPVTVCFCSWTRKRNVDS